MNKIILKEFVMPVMMMALVGIGTLGIIWLTSRVKPAPPAHNLEAPALEARPSGEGEWEIKGRYWSWTFRYVEVDGHEYALAQGGPGGKNFGMAHSPKCPCLAKAR